MDATSTKASKKAKQKGEVGAMDTKTKVKKAKRAAAAVEAAETAVAGKKAKRTKTGLEAAPDAGDVANDVTDDLHEDHALDDEDDTIDAAGAAEATEPGEDEVEASKSFAELGLSEVLCEICTRQGFAAATAIQAKAIPAALQERDIVGRAETGSGKTLAFVLPILQALLVQPRPLFALVLVPTRELAVQVGEVFASFGEIAVRHAVLVGGVDMVSQTIALARRPHVVVATPGRLMDHLEKTKGFALKHLRYLVIDEADRMLDLDFGPHVVKIIQHLPRERRTMLFSATISSKVESLQRACLQDPLSVSVSSGNHTVATLRQWLVFRPLVRKDEHFVYLVNEFSGQPIIVFVRTVHQTHRLTFLLRALGFGAIPLNGRLSMSARLSAINKIQSGSRDILIATDVAARGLHLPRISVVLNYEIPLDSKTYVHRVGRTARAGRSGLAINLVSQYDFTRFLAIEKAIGMAKQIQPYDIDKEAVLLFRPRVEEAQRLAREEMRAFNDMLESRKRGGRGAGGARRPVRGGGASAGRGDARRHDDMDREEE